jgi:transposase
VLKVDIAQWHQEPEDLRNQAVSAAHPRTRERFMALYEISQGKNATQVGLATGRNHQTVMGWVHRYNALGPDSLVYRHTGGHPPLCLVSSKQL